VPSFVSTRERNNTEKKVRKEKGRKEMKMKAGFRKKKKLKNLILDL